MLMLSATLLYSFSVVETVLAVWLFATATGIVRFDFAKVGGLKASLLMLQAETLLSSAAEIASKPLGRGAGIPAPRTDDRAVLVEDGAALACERLCRVFQAR